MDEKGKEEEKQKTGPFYIPKKVYFHKGAIVYTKEGYGMIIKKEDEKNTCVVKVKGKEVSLQKEEI